MLREGKPLQKTTGPPGWRLGVGPTTPPLKKHLVTETAIMYPNPQGPMGISSQATELGSMTAPSESPPREAMSSRRSFLGPKTVIRLETWNVRTMFETGKTAQVTKEMERYDLDILGVSECRWTGTGRKRTGDGFTILFLGKENTHASGVALIISRSTEKTLIEWEPVSDRIIRARFHSKDCKHTILQCYAPTNEEEDEVKDDWYEQLQYEVSRVPQHDMLLIMGDINAKVCSDNSNCETAMGKHGCGSINDNGERLADFCLNNNCIIGGTIFPHKNIHKLTWRSPDDRTINQIDHIMINKKWRRSLLDVKMYRGTDVSSDHYMLFAKIKPKRMAANSNKQCRKVFDINRLKWHEVRSNFSLELKNRFAALATLKDEIDQGSVECSWNRIREAHSDAAKKAVGFKKKGNKKWLSDETWAKIETRRKARVKMLNAKSSRKIERTHRSIRTETEVKGSARKDKRNFIEKLASEAEEAAEKREFSTVYKITKQLCGNNTIHSMPVKDKQGKVVTTEREQAAKCVQHFEEVLNRPDPDEPADPPPSESYLDIDTGPPGIAEVRSAIENLKNGKAPGIDSLQAELLKADIGTTSRLLTDLFCKIWEQEVIPKDWSKGLIFKLPKKGDLGNCDNWRGITLLSVPSKIFCRIRLKRIEKAIDTTLREEQAGFRRGRGCMDQIFALRNILEQSLEWNTPLCINFIDFQKAFDSIHRESLWRILQAYGIPPKIITLIKMFYVNFECSIILENTITEAFPVKSGVRQGCILSPILFLVTIDLVMRQTASLRTHGIQWTIFSHLQDLDFADDIAILSSTTTHLQEMSDDLIMNSKKTGLNISKKKSKIMCVNSSPTRTINIDGEPLDHIEEFTYLGSVISTDNSAQKDIKARLNKARCVFSRLKNIWKSKQYSLSTKVRIYNSNVKSVLLYGAECWRNVKRDIKKVNAFHNSCL